MNIQRADLIVIVCTKRFNPLKVEVKTLMKTNKKKIKNKQTNNYENAFRIVFYTTVLLLLFFYIYKQQQWMLMELCTFKFSLSK